jgi:DNA-binding LacI/PurR family transcriptional regulator
LGHYRLRRALYPLLKGALGRDRPDILVGLNDGIAVAALDVLYRLGVDVPGECAVAGFDDTSLAFTAHLTSYNHNFHAAAREILRFGHTCPDTLNRPMRLGVDGYVVERLTTRGG